jgi:transcriptional regulator with XRE-family HTH domain
MNTIGSRIRTLRKSLNNGKGIKQAEFAEKLGVQHSSVSLWEKDININDKTVKAICYTFNVSEKWLKDGLGDMSPPLTVSDETILEKFRQLSPAVQNLVLNYMDVLLENQAIIGKEPPPEKEDNKSDFLLEPIRSGKKEAPGDFGEDKTAG